MIFDFDSKELSLILSGLYRQLGYLKTHDESTTEIEILIWKCKGEI